MLAEIGFVLAVGRTAKRSDAGHPETKHTYSQTDRETDRPTEMYLCSQPQTAAMFSEQDSVEAANKLLSAGASRKAAPCSRAIRKPCHRGPNQRREKTLPDLMRQLT